MYEYINGKENGVKGIEKWNMANEEKSFKEQWMENYNRGVKLAGGGPEDTSQARLLKTSEPLPNEVAKIKKWYKIMLVATFAGAVVPPMLVLGPFGLLIVYCFERNMIQRKMDKLRKAKFKSIPGADNEQIFMGIQASLTSKYNMLVERGTDGEVVISHNNLIYDILLNDDSTFCVWWRMSLGRAFTSSQNYKMYCRVLADMGMIAYEVQKALMTDNRESQEK